jgi:hypothetical protein
MKKTSYIKNQWRKLINPLNGEIVCERQIVSRKDKLILSRLYYSSFAKPEWGSFLSKITLYDESDGLENDRAEGESLAFNY